MYHDSLTCWHMRPAGVVIGKPKMLGGRVRVPLMTSGGPAAVVADGAADVLMMPFWHS